MIIPVMDTNKKIDKNTITSTLIGVKIKSTIYMNIVIKKDVSIDERSFI